jgi:hypothetical protein
MIKIKYRATIITNEFEYNYSDDVSDNNAQAYTEDIGKIPVIIINGVQISKIKKLKLYNTKIFPELELEFNDTSNELTMDKYPADDTILSLYKQSTSTALDIKMDFKIIEYKIINSSIDNHNDYVTLKIKAILNIDDLYLYNFESYKDTSYNVLDKLSKDMKLGFASNIDNTNDNMIWINPGMIRQEYMKDIISHSYIDDNTYLFGYVDFYYNFNYVDINKQLNDDISEQNNIGHLNNTFSDIKEEPTPLILSNNKNNKITNMYIDKYTIIQDSTKVNIETGYRFRFSEYDIIKDKTNIYLLDSITNSDENTIILKGNPFMKTNKLYNESINGNFFGRIDTDIVHKNYLHSKIQNNYNLKYLQKLKITIKLIIPNYSLYRFQKVLLELYNNVKLNTKKDQAGEKDIINEYDSKLIHRLSGEWLITAISFNFTENEGNSQEITLVKRDLTNLYEFPRR